MPKTRKFVVYFVDITWGAVDPGTPKEAELPKFDVRTVEATGPMAAINKVESHLIAEQGLLPYANKYARPA